MASFKSKQLLLRAWVATVGITGALGLTGCHIESNGQVLPSPYYLTDDIQYFPPGSEFKLQKEANAMKAAANDRGFDPSVRPSGPESALPPAPPAPPAAASPL